MSTALNGTSMRQLTFLDSAEAADRRDKGMERAADHAGDEWKKLAAEAFRQYARTHAEFRTEQVRDANPDIPEPPDKRAWGSIAVAAAKAGLVRSGGTVKAHSRTVHRMSVTLWISNCCESKGLASEKESSAETSSAAEASRTCSAPAL